MSDTILEVDSLSKVFLGKGGAKSKNDVHAVSNISFNLQRGECLGLVGESGCGKSTTARMLVGLHQPSNGEIYYNGNNLAGLSSADWKKYRPKIQMIFQDPYASLDPRQTIESILVEALSIHRIGSPKERRARALSMLEIVGLNPRHIYRYPHEFSGGQRQRIGIARALMLEPELLICDEPVSALDVSIQAQVINLLKSLQERFGLSLLFIAHDLAVVRHLCDRIAVMYLGKIVEIAPREQLFENPQHPYTRALLSAVPLPDPELEAKRERILLHGDPPSPSNPPSGCTFHTRCQERKLVDGKACEEVSPELTNSKSCSQSSFACHIER